MSAVSYRSATRHDVATIVEMLANDPLGAGRERFVDPLPESYGLAFDAIDRDPNNDLVVAEAEGVVVGVMQLTFIPNLTYQGSWRAHVEGVRVSESVRGQGIGRGMLREAIRRAKEKPCRLVQLTTDKARPDAIRFYESLGFQSSHEGMKLTLST